MATSLLTPSADLGRDDGDVNPPTSRLARFASAELGRPGYTASSHSTSWRHGGTSCGVWMCGTYGGGEVVGVLTLNPGRELCGRSLGLDKVSARGTECEGQRVRTSVGLRENRVALRMCEMSLRCVVCKGGSTGVDFDESLESERLLPAVAAEAEGVGMGEATTVRRERTVPLVVRPPVGCGTMACPIVILKLAEELDTASVSWTPSPRARGSGEAEGSSARVTYILLSEPSSLCSTMPGAWCLQGTATPLPTTAVISPGMSLAQLRHLATPAGWSAFCKTGHTHHVVSYYNGTTSPCTQSAAYACTGTTETGQ